MIRVFVIAVLMVGAAGLLGCERAVFSEELPRTQFERYDERRGVYRPKETLDPRGYTVPDLRGRLSAYQ